MNKQKTKHQIPNTKQSKGITLVALIITIVVLLILAIVSIGAVQDSGIIAHAQNAGDRYTIAQEKEQLGLAVSEWQIQKVIPENTKTFKEVIADALQGQIEEIGADQPDDGPLTVTFTKTGNSYTVTKDSGITPVTKGITLSSTTLSIAPGATAQLVATLTGGVTGDIIWTSANTDVIAITVSEDKLTATVTAGETAGETAITVACGEYRAECEVRVEEETALGLKAFDIRDKFYSNYLLLTTDNKGIIISEEDLITDGSFSVVTLDFLQITGIDEANNTVSYGGYNFDIIINSENVNISDLNFFCGEEIGLVIATTEDRSKLYIADVDTSSFKVKLEESSGKEHNSDLLTQLYHNSSDYGFYITESFYYQLDNCITFSNAIFYIKYSGDDSKIIGVIEDPFDLSDIIIYESEIVSTEILSNSVTFEKIISSDLDKENVTINAGAKKVTLSDGEVAYIQDDNLYILNGCLSLTNYMNSDVFFSIE